MGKIATARMTVTAALVPSQSIYRLPLIEDERTATSSRPAIAVQATTLTHTVQDEKLQIRSQQHLRTTLRRLPEYRPRQRRRRTRRRKRHQPLLLQKQHHLLRQRNRLVALMTWTD